MFIAFALLGVSVILAIFVLAGLNSDGPLPWAILGYIFTPFGTAACLIWARALDLRNQSDPGYLKLDGQRRLKILGIVVLVSFIPALAFIWYLASYVGSVIA
jgi:membrane protein implicated in regulation of membrane protease activity